MSDRPLLSSQLMKNTMLNAIKQEVTVLPNGLVSFRSPELKAGSRVEVIVILKETSPPPLYDAIQNEEMEAKPTLTELLAQVATEKERMTLTYRKKVFLAVVPIEDIEMAKQLKKCLQNYTQTQVETLCVDDALGEFIETKADEKAYLTLTYQNQIFLAVVPIEKVDAIKQLEDCIDNADADDALKEEGESFTSEQVDKILGW